MRTVEIEIEGASPYGAGKVFDEREPRANESHDEHEKRCWQQRLNVDGDGRGIIPPMAFARAIQNAAKSYGGKIKGKGNATWTKHFDAGILVVDPLVLDGVTRENVKGHWQFVPSSGISGDGKRVMKCFPVVHKWGGKITVFVLNDEITPEIFAKVVDAAFKLVGVGVFRPERRGYWGRAKVLKVEWK